MHNSLISFSYFNNRRIVIPQIQRDYAEGRNIGRIPEIRKSLLGEMISVVCGEKASTELDFVYGYERNGSFEPLDGQQRLTTLFLLQWMLAGNAGKMMVNVDGKRCSRLTYQNRESSSDFCELLVKHTSTSVIQGYESKKSKKKNLTLIQHIKESGWYRWNWNYDSTIQSMLVVINDIYNMLKEKPSYDCTNTTQFLNNFYNIRFRFLNLETFMMGDELYIKMNARGKELSSFDLLKSFLEHNLSSCTADGDPIRLSWKESMDCDWMDYLWWKYYTKVPQNQRSVESIEKNYEKILTILMWYQMLLNSNNSNIGKLANQQFDNIISIYKGNGFTIDYSLLMKQFNSLFIRCDNSFEDLDSVVDIFDNSLLSKCNDGNKYDDLIFLYAYIIWTTTITDRLTDILTDQNKKENLSTYLRFIKNIYELDNAGTSRIDSPDDFLKAMKWIEEIVNQYKDTGVSFREFIRDTVSYRQGAQVLEVSIEEEKTKARLILEDGGWKNEIEYAEQNRYLKGQIYSLLHIEHNDIVRFRNLVSKFYEIIDSETDNANGNLSRLLQLLMLFDLPYNLPPNGSQKGSLLEVNQDRDYSLKNHLRSRNSNVLVAFKSVMDFWMNQVNDGYNFNTFFSETIRVKQNIIASLPYWRQFLINTSKWCNSLYPFSKHYFSLEENGLLYIKKSMAKEELLICHIHGVVRKDNNMEIIEESNDEKTICFKHNNVKYKVQLTDINEYLLEIDDNTVATGVDYKYVIDTLNTRCATTSF